MSARGARGRGRERAGRSREADASEARVDAAQERIQARLAAAGCGEARERIQARVAMVRREVQRGRAAREAAARTATGTPGTGRRSAAREAIRQQVAARVAAARGRVRVTAPPGGGSTDAARWRRWLGAALILLVALLLVRDCGGPEAPAAEEAEPLILPSEQGDAAPAPPPPPLSDERITGVDRPRLEVEEPDALPWLEELSLQVSARGPRLAACFVGALRPGALRWTARLEPSTGLVSEQKVEAASTSVILEAGQRACVKDVLADPPYRLDGGDERAAPVPVGMVVSF